MPRHHAAFVTAVFLTVSTGIGKVHAASVRFIALTDEVAAREISFKDSKRTTKLKDVSAKKRSDALTYTAGKKPLLLLTPDRKNVDGEPESVELNLTAEIKSPLVLILPDAQHASGLKAIIIDDSATRFPWGSLRFINTTGNVLTIRYEKETKPLPLGDAPVDIVPGGDTRNVGVQLFEENDPAKILYSAVWEHDPKVRKLVFVISDADHVGRAFDLIILPEDERVKK